MSNNHRHMHNAYTSGYLTGGDGNYGSFTTALEPARTKNFPSWITTTHPEDIAELNAEKLHVTYLKELYPNIWQYGPAGDILAAGLTAINSHLDDLGYANHGTAFLDAICNDLDGISHVDEDFDFLPALITHAHQHGLPLPGDLILGSIETQTEPSHAENLLNHYIWLYYPTDKDDFANFIYDFSLISIHHTYLTTLQNDTVKTALRQYDAFCDTWGIPR